MRSGQHTQTRRFTLADAGDVITILGRFVRAQLGVGPVTRGATSLVLDPDGRLLLVRTRYQRGWTCSGGFLDPGEDPLLGIRRELGEEVGLPSHAEPQLAAQIPRNRHLDLVFSLQVDVDTAASLQPMSWEIARVGWFGPHDLPRLNEATRRLVAAPAGLIAADGRRWRLVGPH